MDEATFSRELSRLKEHVTRVPPMPRKSPPLVQHALHQGNFEQQLLEMKSQLTSMHKSLENQAAQLKAQRIETPTPVLVKPEPVSQPHTLPSRFSEPPLWQILTSIQTEIQGLGCRVGCLEDAASELEHRVNILDPPIFTPACSEDDGSNLASDDASPIGMAQRNYSGSEVGPLMSELDGFELNPQAGTAAHNNPRTEITKDFVDFASGPPPESIAFRDREINNLEELCWTAHDRLRVSDDLVAEKETELASTRLELQGTEARLSHLLEREKNQQQLIAALSGKVEELTRENASCEDKLQRQQSDLSALKQSLSHKEFDLFAADSKLKQLQCDVDLQRGEMKSAAAATENANHEISRLCGLLKQRDALLTEQNSQIERINLNLSRLRGEHQTPDAERDDYARSLQAKHREMDQLRAVYKARKCQNRHSSQGTWGQTGLSKPSQERQTSKGKPNVAAPVAPSSSANRWTPRPIRGYAKLPHEMKRPFEWKQPYAYKPTTFGIPSDPIPPQPDTVDEDARMLRRSNSLRLLRKLAVDEGIKHPPAHHLLLGPARRSATPPSKNRLLDAQPLSPAPGPLARRMDSPPNLQHHSNEQSDDTSHMQRRISKSRSMHEFPRRGLQAYVEDDALGGDA